MSDLAGYRCCEDCPDIHNTTLHKSKTLLMRRRNKLVKKLNTASTPRMICSHGRRQLRCALWLEGPRRLDTFRPTISCGRCSYSSNELWLARVVPLCIYVSSALVVSDGLACESLKRLKSACASCMMSDSEVTEETPHRPWFGRPVILVLQLAR